MTSTPEHSRRTRTPRARAMEFIAAHERPDPDAYDREVARLARKWLRIMTSTCTTQGVVNRLLEELDVPPEGSGCSWADLRQAILDWATAEQWLEPTAQTPPGSR